MKTGSSLLCVIVSQNLWTKLKLLSGQCQLYGALNVKNKLSDSTGVVLEKSQGQKQFEAI